MEILPQIPQGSAHVLQTTNLGGVPYRLSFDFNQRLGRWFLSILRVNGTPVLESKALVCGVNLLRYTREIPGALFVLDAAAAAEDPGFVGLAPGGAYALVYVS
jgi:hypothetical protein